MCQVQNSNIGQMSSPGQLTYEQRGQSSWISRDSSGGWAVHGSGQDDSIQVSSACVRGNEYLKIQVNQDVYWVPVSGPNAAQSVSIYAGRGNDSVFVDPQVDFPLFIEGGAGNDYLKGGNGPNALIGGDGNDLLIGGPKDDLFIGGSGCDTAVTGGGRDMFSIMDMFHRIRRGMCRMPEAIESPYCRPAPPSPCPSTPPPQQTAPQPLPPMPQPSPSMPPVVPLPHQNLPQPPPPPQKPTQPSAPRPDLSDLMRLVDSFKEPGFKSGRNMAKNLLTALYQSPDSLRQALASIGSEKERDDAAASLVRAMLEAGPLGAQMLKSLPSDIRRTLFSYMESGNAWSAKKIGICLAMARSISPALANSIANSRDNFRTTEAQAAYQQSSRDMGVA